MRSLLPLLLLPQALAAQTMRIPASALPNYPRVQIWASAVRPDPLVGTVTAADSSRVIIKPRGSLEVIVPVDRIERAEVVAGVDRMKGGLIGLAFGAAVAAVVYKLHLDAAYANDEWNVFSALFRAAPVGGAVGFVAGAAIGWDRWRPVVITPSTDAHSAPAGLRDPPPWP